MVQRCVPRAGGDSRHTCMQVREVNQNWTLHWAALTTSVVFLCVVGRRGLCNVSRTVNLEQIMCGHQKKKRRRRRRHECYRYNYGKKNVKINLGQETFVDKDAHTHAHRETQREREREK